jgi:hypothetical protein
VTRGGGSGRRGTDRVGRSVRSSRRLVTVIVMVAVIGLCAACSSSPETPENAVIDFGVDVQLGHEAAALGRVCDAKRADYQNHDSAFYASVKATDGYKGLSGYKPGFDPKTIDDHTVVVYGSAGNAGPPTLRGFSPPENVWASTMVREHGKWKVCGLEMTGATVPGFDTRLPCFPGETPNPTDPRPCRTDS